MTATSKGDDSGTLTAEASTNVFSTLAGLNSAADALNLTVQGYVQDTADSIGVFDPAYTAPLPVKSFLRSYAGYTIDKTGMPDDLVIDDAPTFDENIGGITFDTVTDPGDYTGYAYTPNFPPVLNLPTVSDPGDWDETIDVTVPTNLVVSEPTDMTLQTIIIPTIPNLEISEFTATAPDFGDVREIDAVFNFSEVDYTSDVLTQTDLLIQQMIAGGVGVPKTIWNRIWERGGVQIDQAFIQQKAGIKSEWGAAGWSMPQGPEIALIEEARQNAFNKKAEFARDNTIAYSQEEIKNLQFAVQQGIAFENLRGGWYQQYVQRSLEAAKYVVESQISLLQADIALVNAKASVYNTEAQVYKTLIDAEIAKLETQRLEIQAQGLAIQSNDSQIKLYGARIDALKLNIEEFNSNVQAAATEADVMKTKVQVYAEEIKAFVARLQAQKTEVDIYTATIGAETSKVGAYQASVSAYGEEIKAFSSKIGASSAKADAETKIEQLKLQKYDSIIKGYATKVGAKSDAYKAEVSGFDTYVKAEMAQADDSYKQNTSLLESDKNSIAYESENVKIALANATASVRAAEATVKVAIDTNKSMAEINAGLAGSVYAAISVSSSESESASVSVGRNYNTGYDGGIV